MNVSASRRPVWLTVLVATAVGVSAVACGSGAGTAARPARSPSIPQVVGPVVAAVRPAAEVHATVANTFTRTPLFGVSVQTITPEENARITRVATCRPAMYEFFVALTTGLDPGTLDRIPGVPVMTLEPWDPTAGADESRFTLEQTISGRWDAAYRAMAKTIRDFRRPVVIRYAHEMNGYWYPWSAVGHNTPEQYVAAWRHVVGLFRAAGVTNVLWVWSPNIVRGTDETPLTRYYPGDAWVDLVGLSGYGVHEPSAFDTYNPSVHQLQQMTKRPILLTEVGAQPDSDKTKWISTFGQWLRTWPSVVGFIWFERSKSSGARADWRFDDTAANVGALRYSMQVGKVACG